eukprot:gene42477-65281_t
MTGLFVVEQCAVLLIAVSCAVLSFHQVRMVAAKVPLPQPVRTAAHTRWLALKDWDGMARLQRIALPALPGLLGSASNTWLKVTESLLSAPDWRPSRLSWWGVALLTGLIAACQLASLNAALSRLRASDVIPVTNGVLLMGGTLAGVLVGDGAVGAGALFLLLLGAAHTVVCAAAAGGRRR